MLIDTDSTITECEHEWDEVTRGPYGTGEYYCYICGERYDADEAAAEAYGESLMEARWEDERERWENEH